MPIKYSKQQWEAMQPLLDEALNKPVGERERFLRDLKVTDPITANAIRELLNTEDYDLPFLTMDLEDSENLDTEPLPSYPETLGGYRICEIIGQGGMGVVFRAERAQGDFERQVAIKLVSIHYKDPNKRQQQLARFQFEQQTLASLEHPQIAQIYDGGFSPEGQPYIVMEYVKGVSLVDYCLNNKLSIEKKLELLIQVSKALSYAHRNLVVHRDIKSSNILVCEKNGEAQIKLLDFGIAKLIDSDINDDLTRTGDMLLTLGSAAPEQIKNENITVATDIYQLGLVLYEILTGSKAFSDKAESLYDLTSVVATQTPTNPSTFVKQGNNPDLELSRLLKGELDAIILKALATDKNDRYASMDDFSSDLTAFVNHDVVQAQQQSWAYLVQKHMRRHWQAWAVTSSFLILLVVYAITITVQSNRIEQALAKSQLEEYKARQVSNFMVDIFKQADPNVRGLAEITADELLQKGEEDIQEKLRDVPEIRTHLLAVIGDIYYSQGNYANSAKLLREAVDQIRLSDLVTNDWLKYYNLKTKLAISLSSLDDYDEAETLLAQNIATYQQKIPENPSQKYLIDYAEALNALGNLLFTKGDYTKAQMQYRQANELLKDLEAPHNELAVALNGLSIIAYYQGQLTESLQLIRESLEVTRQVYGTHHSNYTKTLDNIVSLLVSLENFSEAEDLNARSLSIQQQMLEDTHPYISHLNYMSGLLSHRMGNFEQAKSKLTKSLEIKVINKQKEHLSTTKIYLLLGKILQDQGQFDEAKIQYRKAFEIFQSAQANTQLIGRAHIYPAELAMAEGNANEAKLHYQRALDLLPASGLRTSIAQLGWARASIILSEDSVLVTERIDNALKTRLSALPDNHSLIAEARAIKGLSLINQQPKDAATLLQQAYDVLHTNPLFVNRKSEYHLLMQIKNALAKHRTTS